MEAAALAACARMLGFDFLASGCWLMRVDGNHGRFPSFLLAGLLLLVLGSTGIMVATVAPIAARLDEPLFPLLVRYVVVSRSGLFTVVAATAGMLAGALLSLSALVHEQRMRRVGGIAAALLLGTAALAIAASGHAVSSPGGDATMVLQALHIACAVAWLGLLMSVLPASTDGSSFTIRLARASNPALLLVAVAILSGVITAWFHGVRPEDLATLEYGRLLLLKATLLAVALLAAGWNRWIGLPGGGTGPGAEIRMRRMLKLETSALVLAVIAAAALSRALPPH